jgi:uncharacterized protein (TIGR02996 family)
VPTHRPRVALTHDDAFVQAICESPDDDTPRLVYADYLDERGDPRGEFIRVQCELARLPEDDERREDLEAKERELLRRHRREWLRPLRGLLSKCEFCRGFVEEGIAAADVFTRRADDIFRAAPLRRVRLTKPLTRADQLACTRLSRLTGLAFGPGVGVAHRSWPSPPRLAGRR